MSFIKEESPATLALPDEKKNILETQTRTEQVKEAISAGNWDALRALSLLPDGFGDARMEAWYVHGTREPFNVFRSSDYLLTFQQAVSAKCEASATNKHQVQGRIPRTCQTEVSK